VELAHVQGNDGGEYDFDGVAPADGAHAQRHEDGGKQARFFLGGCLQLGLRYMPGYGVGAIRWRDAIEIVFAAVISLYVRKLYLLSREQHKILSHAIRSAEYAAAAAKRSADICETLMQEHKKPDENQGKLDI
ncbi:MAG: hypothetical protein EBV03_05950, partial [Proteobacteria bacterium]|nr:hypothetical protein [Pseudomonadota bacterium]